MLSVWINAQYCQKTEASVNPHLSLDSLPLRTLLPIKVLTHTALQSLTSAFHQLSYDDTICKPALVRPTCMLVRIGMRRQQIPCSFLFVELHGLGPSVKPRKPSKESKKA